MAFTPQFLDEIRARVALSDVIGRRVRLIRKGREHSALCPFHNEKTPSFTVSDDKGFFHCFGCGAHGDVIGFVMRDEGLSFPEAVERLAGEAGLEVPKETPQDRARAEAQLSLYAVLEEAAKFFEDELKSSSGAATRAYLRGRGVKAESVEIFRLGYAPKSRNALKSALSARNISEALLITAGLLIEPEGGGASYDRFRDRVIFPISDRRGRVIAFGGRAFGDAQPKYLNSPDTPLFQKGNMLYGMHLARSAARKSGKIIAVEGYMDVIALHQAGLTETVAPLGTALTELQIEEMWRLADAPVLCFDGDAAGRRAVHRTALRALPRLQGGKTLRFALLPYGEDPDQYISSRGRPSFDEILARAERFSEMLWKSAVSSEKLESPESRAIVNRRMGEYISAIQDKEIKYQFQQFVRQRLRKWGIELVAGTDYKRRKDAGLSLDWNSLKETKYGSNHPREKTLLQIILTNPKILDEMNEEISKIEFFIPKYAALLSVLLEASRIHVRLHQSDIEYHLISQGFVSIVDELVGKDAVYLDWRRSDNEGNLDRATELITDILSMYYRYLGLRKNVEDAQIAFTADPNQVNSDRLLTYLREILEAGGDDADLTQFGRLLENMTSVSKTENTDLDNSQNLVATK